jgi:hypothetical protein
VRRVRSMSRLGKAGRFFAAGFDTVVMAGVAGTETGGRIGATFGESALWGAVLAAAICTLIIALDRWAEIAWIAIGYVFFGGLLTPNSPHFGLVLLGLALVPMVPRPRESLTFGIGIAAAAAIAMRLLAATAL